MDPTRLTRLLPCLVAVLLAAAAPAFAQLPAARLTAVFPPGGTVGSTVDVAATGADLDGATELRFSHPGLVAKPNGDAGQTEAKFSVVVGKDVPVGVYEARVVGRFGISNPRAFAVTDRPTAETPKGHNSPGSAAKLPVGSVVNARTTANAVDHYAFELKKGQRALIECESREVDSRLAPVLALTDATGRELDRTRRGGLLDVTAPADGTYTLQVHDLLYRGGDEFFYRLTVGTAPRVDAIFPPAGLPGTKGKYTLYGRLLPGGTASDLRGADGKPLEQLDVEVELPPKDGDAARRIDGAPGLVGTAGAMLDGVEYRLRSDRGTSNPVLVTFARAAVVAEQEPNDDPAKAPRVSTPCEVAGRFYPRGDADWVAFEAAKGDALWIEVVSDRLGVPTGPFVLVQQVTKNDKGEEQAKDVQELSGVETPGRDASAGGPAFRTATRDAGVLFTAKESGTYRVLVRDLFNTARNDPSLAYRLSIRPAQPDFRLVATPTPARGAGNNAAAEAAVNVATPFLRKGGSATLQIMLFRQEGFDGPVKVEVDGLPPGAACPPVTIPPGENAVAVVVAVGDDAKEWAGTVRVVGKATVGGAEVTREARAGSLVWGPLGTGQNITEPPQARLTRDLAMAISGAEHEPIAVRAEAEAYEAAAGETVKIPLKLTKRGEAKMPIKVKPAGLAALKDVKEINLDKDTGSLEIDLSKVKLAPGTYTFHLQSQVAVKYDRDAAGGGAKPNADDKGKTGDDGKKDDKKKDDKKGGAKDVQATFYSAPITLTVKPSAKAETK